MQLFLTNSFVMLGLSEEKWELILEKKISNSKIWSRVTFISRLKFPETIGPYSKKYIVGRGGAERHRRWGGRTFKPFCLHKSSPQK